MKIPFLFILTLYSHQAFASYENSCDLVVKLLENMTIETLAVARSDGLSHKGHIHLISFKGLVKKHRFLIELIQAVNTI